jgi:chromosomal replication initiator protein
VTNSYNRRPRRVPSARVTAGKSGKSLRRSDCHGEPGPRRVGDLPSAEIVKFAAEVLPADPGENLAAEVSHQEGSFRASILAGLRERLGDERFAVWFGDSCRVDVAPASDGGRAVTLWHEHGAAGDWLRRTFGGDLQAVAESVCAEPVVLTWQPLPAATVSEGQSVDSDSQAAPRCRPPSRSAAVPKRQAGRRPSSKQAAEGQGGQLRTGNSAGSLAGRQAVRLEDFVVGPSNRMAYAAVELAVNRLGEMSPVLLHGPSGVGKTHLLSAIYNFAREQQPGLTAVMLSAEQFTTNFLQALQGKGLPSFRRSCRSVDLLVVDDLQFFVGKRATLLELQSTVDTLHRAGKQVIFASDRDLESLEALGSELTGRIRGGMTAALMPPDGEVRRGIVAGLAARRRLDMPAEVTDYLADHLTRHARELIGGVNRLEAASHMLGVPITLELAQESLTDLIRSSSRSLRLADIERAVCTAFGIDDAELQSSRRTRSVNHPRMLAMFLARKHTGAALSEIGRYFGRRSHSTVISAEKTVRKWLSSQAPVVLADASWDIDQAIRRVEDVLRAG